MNNNVTRHRVLSTVLQKIILSGATEGTIQIKGMSSSSGNVKMLMPIINFYVHFKVRKWHSI